MTAEIVAGRYRLQKRVGLGGMSEVWSAQDLELDREVALKLVAPDADRQRFEREAQAVARLSHPHIGGLYDYGETGGRPYMVLELLQGGSLDDLLHGGKPLPDPDADRIAAELASALAYAHSHGVLHRDVKPSNVLFDFEGSAKLVDFGIARVVGQPTLTEAGTVLGTAAYISPEQALGDPVTPASDVYAFGAVLYQMLTGHPPFEGSDALEVAAMHATRDPPSITSVRPDAPPELARVAAAALAKHPKDRPPDGTALVELLAGGSATYAEAATEVIPPRRASRIGWGHVAMVGALLMLAVLGAGAAVLATPDESKAPVTGTTPRTTTHRATTAGTTAPMPAPQTESNTTRTATTATQPAPPSVTQRTSTRTPSTAPMTTAPTTTATQPTTTTEVTTTAPTTTETAETTTTTTTSG